MDTTVILSYALALNLLSGIAHEVIDVCAQNSTQIQQEQQLEQTQEPQLPQKEDILISTVYQEGVIIEKLQQFKMCIDDAAIALEAGEIVNAQEQLNTASGMIDEIEQGFEEFSMLSTRLDEAKEQYEKISEELSSYAIFEITAYCSCYTCCNIEGIRGQTASGAMATANYTVAMDPQYEFGTHIKIAKLGEYVVEDRGSQIVGNRIDIYFTTHEEACNFPMGAYYVKVM